MHYLILSVNSLLLRLAFWASTKQLLINFSNNCIYVISKISHARFYVYLYQNDFNLIKPAVCCYLYHYLCPATNTIFIRATSIVRIITFLSELNNYISTLKKLVLRNGSIFTSSIYISGKIVGNK